MSSRIRIGLLGLGQRGLQHLAALWKLQGEGLVEVVALADTFPENLDEAKIQQYVPGFQKGGLQFFSDFDALLQGKSMDALYVSIPPNCHRGEVVRAAQAGLHLFIEKPMSLSMDEAREMDQAIREANVIATVGFQLRYDSWNQAAREFLADKRLVMLTTVGHGTLESHSVKHTPTEQKKGPTNRVWAANYEWSGSTVVEAGIHTLDLWRYWCGDVAWVQAAYVHRDPEDIVDGGNNPYAYSVTFGFRQGCLGNLILSRLRRTYHSEGYQSILWDHGYLRMEPEGLVAYTYEGPYPPSEPPSPSQLRHPLPTPPRNDATEAINRAFVEAVSQGQPHRLRSSFTGSLNSLAAVLAANLSDQRGGEQIDLQGF